jgi:hypothetical protein
MARRLLRRTASLIYLIAVVAGLGPPYAQRHEPDELAPLRGEVSELYSDGNYAEAIPLAEQYVAIARQLYGPGAHGIRDCHCLASVRLLCASREVPRRRDENRGANAWPAFALKEVAGFYSVGCCGKVFEVFETASELAVASSRATQLGNWRFTL